MQSAPFSLWAVRLHAKQWRWVFISRYNPGEYTAVDVLRERDVDAAFVMSADLVSHFPATCPEYLKEIPTACIDIAPCPTTLASDVVLPGVIVRSISVQEDTVFCESTLNTSELELWKEVRSWRYLIVLRGCEQGYRSW